MHKGIKREKTKFCDICGQACFATSDLKRHMASIHGIGMFMLSRQICNALFYADKEKVIGKVLEVFHMRLLTFIVYYVFETQSYLNF